jgi:hypothetical protein
MAITYDKIQSTTLGSATSSITFSSISSTYTDLRIVLTYTTSISGEDARVRFNSDTGTNYSITRLRGTGAAGNSSTLTSQSSLILCDNVSIGSSTTIPQLLTLDIFSYAGSTYKTLLSENSSDYNGSGTITRTVGLWRSASAISTILIGTLTAATFNIGTTATLYGIKAA